MLGCIGLSLLDSNNGPYQNVSADNPKVVQSLTLP